MTRFAVVIERDPSTGLYVGDVLGLPGAHSQAESMEELRLNLREVLELLKEDGPLTWQSEFVGVEQLQLAEA
ncbi:hypothetical protein BH24DEI1_BH24DEI1_10380 [soil metagenome]